MLAGTLIGGVTEIVIGGMVWKENSAGEILTNFANGATDGAMWAGIASFVTGMVSVAKNSANTAKNAWKAENAAQNVGEGGSTSAFEEAFKAADNYNLSDDTYINHILDRHGSDSSFSNKSHFNSGFDIKEGISSTLIGDNFTVMQNTNGRNGYIFEQTFKNAIGVNSKGKQLYTLKVVIDEDGKVITAFPKK